VFYRPKLGCSVCGNGLVAFVVAADGKRLVLFCIQCGTWYASIEHENYQLSDSTVAEGPDLHLVECDCSVKFPPARWATAEEVRDFGWGDYLDPEPIRWLPDQLWPAEEWAARLRGVDVWEWHASSAQPPPQTNPPRKQLLDAHGNPIGEPDGPANQSKMQLLDQSGKPIAKPGGPIDRPRD
jgi:hypothetical protein